MGKFIDLTNKRFGRLLVLSRAETINKRTMWLCICDCGEEKKIRSDSLISKNTMSCGCLNDELVTKNFTKHGLRCHPLYDVHKNIKQRCLNKNNSVYSDYGGRGITICDEWKDDFKPFYDWAINNGYKRGLEIDRTDNNGNYEPLNCRFVDRRKNILNTRKRVTNTSGYVGIAWNKRNKKWRSRITVFGEVNHLGDYIDIEDAIKARNKYIIDKC